MKNLLKFLIVTVFLLMIIPKQGWVQEAGDYRSKAAGNWNATSSWEK